MIAFARRFAPVLATFTLLAGCAAEPAPEEDPVHVRTMDDLDDDQVTPQLRCRSGKNPEPMTCCDVSDGCTRKYRCWACF